MGYETVNFIYLAEMLGANVVDIRTDRPLGRLVDLAASTGQVYPKIAGLIVGRLGRSEDRYIPWSCVRRSEYKRRIAVDLAGMPEGNGRAAENEILLKKSFLDRQLISTSGSKLVRVNDLQLLIDNTSKENASLWLVHIDIGVKGLLRRLGWLHPVNAAFRWLISRDMKDKFVSWKYIQPTSTTNVYGSLRLTTDSSKLSEIHPADLADIMEDLGTDERISVIESLTPTVAAAAIQEMPMNLRVRIAETLETDFMAHIIQSMQRDESVDLLDEMSAEKRNALFAVLPADVVAELKELSKLSAYSVGSIMNTEFITVKKGLKAREVLELIKDEARRAELIYYVYVLDQEDRLIGIASLRGILTSPPDLPIEEVMREQFVSITIDERIKSVAQMFLKYNFEAIPVVDDERHPLGIVTLRDTLESVFPRMREESA